MKITVLSENYVCKKGLNSEHGLSLFVEIDDKKILFDMGQGDVFLKNANSLNVDLAQVDVAVLSHGHYDHGGGVKCFLENNSKALVYVNENAFGKFYSKNGYIGLDNALKRNQRVRLISEPTEIFPFAKIIPAKDVPLVKDNYSYGLEKELSQKRVPDDFLHEQYLLLEDNGKKYLFSGCSHRGVLNIMNFFKPDVFVGGFHLVSLEEGSGELNVVSKELNEYPSTFYTCHCTGVNQYAFLKSALGEKLDYLWCGKTVVI